MFRPLSLFVGLRYSRAKHKNKFVSVISIASILGVALGVMVLIVGLSTMNGFEKALREDFLSVIPHGELEQVHGEFKDIHETLQIIESDPRVLGASPYITLNALLQKNSKMKALQIRAIATETEHEVTDVERYIQGGGWELLDNNQNTIILGSTVAKRLNVAVGENLTLLIPEKSIGNSKLLKKPRALTFKLVGLFKMGGQMDTSVAYINIEQAKNILGMKQASAIGFKVNDFLQAREIAREVGYGLDDYLYIKSWITSQGYLYQDIQMVKTLMMIILLLVVAVACFNIVSTLVMAVNEKRGDIAILKTMGASKAMLRTIFIVQGAFNGLVGSLLGMLAGVYLALNLTDIIKALEGLIGHKILSGDIYFIDFIPSEININQVFIITSVAFLMSVLSTIYPAWRASAVKPAQELGYSH